MSKYDVKIERISHKHNHGFRYRITVLWDRERDRGDVGWSYTLWGAHRMAKKLIRKYEDKVPQPVLIEEYEL